MDLRGEEPRRGLVSLEMYLSGNWLQPQLLNTPYYNKPPLFNWIVGFLFALNRGVADVLVRLPSLAAWCFLAWWHYRLTRNWIGEWTARLASLFLLTGSHFLFFATVLSGELDLFYSMLVYLQVMAIFQYEQQKNWLKLFLISYLFMALGFLTKGIPSLAFQAITLGGWLVLRGHWKKLFSWYHLLGLSIGLSMLGTYFLVYDWHTGQAQQYLIKLLSEASQKSVAENSQGLLLRLLTFPFQFLAMLLPWSVIIYFGFARRRQLSWEHPYWTFSLFFFVSNIWLYWISPEARDRYLYMFVPFAASALAWILLKTSVVQVRTVLWISLSLACARIGYDLILLPSQQKQMKNLQLYRKIVQETIATAGPDSVAITGHRVPVPIRIPVLKTSIIRDSIPVLPYPIPYYLAKTQGRIIPFHEKPHAGIWYLVTADDLPEVPSTIARRYPIWDGKILLLCQFTAESSLTPAADK